METIHYRIANHFFAVTAGCEAGMLRQMTGFPVFKVSDALPETGWSVVFGSSFPVRFAKVMYEFVFEDSSIICRFGRSDDGYLFSMTPSDPSTSPLHLFYSGGDVVYADVAASPTILRFALWMAFALLGAPCGLLPVHASTVVCPSGAVLCLGESGTGKSTHTRLWLDNIPQTRLLNDDSPILSLESGAPVIFGSPWSGKTHCYHNVGIPVCAGIRLSQAPYNKISRLPTIRAFSALQPSCPPAFAHDEHYSDYIVNIVGATISSVPFFHLACLPNAEAALLSHDTIVKVCQNNR